MRVLLSTVLLAGVSGSAVAQATQPPRLVSAQLGEAPWNVQGAGIAACDVTIDENGAVAGAELVQDVPPFGAQLADAVRSWRFEAAREGDRRVATHVLVLGLFRPQWTVPTPEKPLYKTTPAPEELPWPTFVALPPYPANVMGNGKVVVEADVSDEGKVVSAHSLGAATGFDSAALDAARQWTFRPAARSGRPIPSRAFLVFSFMGASPAIG
jgi:TonB family protein